MLLILSLSRALSVESFKEIQCVLLIQKSESWEIASTVDFDQGTVAKMARFLNVLEESG